MNSTSATAREPRQFRVHAYSPDAATPRPVHVQKTEALRTWHASERARLGAQGRPSPASPAQGAIRLHRSWAPASPRLFRFGAAHEEQDLTPDTPPALCVTQHQAPSAREAHKAKRVFYADAAQARAGSLPETLASQPYRISQANPPPRPILVVPQDARLQDSADLPALVESAVAYGPTTIFTYANRRPPSYGESSRFAASAQAQWGAPARNVSGTHGASMFRQVSRLQAIQWRENLSSGADMPSPHLPQTVRRRRFARPRRGFVHKLIWKLFWPIRVAFACLLGRPRP